MDKNVTLSTLEEEIEEAKKVLDKTVEKTQGDLSVLSEDFKGLDNLITEHFKLIIEFKK